MLGGVSCLRHSGLNPSALGPLAAAPRLRQQRARAPHLKPNRPACLLGCSPDSSEFWLLLHTCHMEGRVVCLFHAARPETVLLPLRGRGLMQDARPRGWQAVATGSVGDGSLWPSSAGQLGRPISRGDGNVLLADIRHRAGENIDCSECPSDPRSGREAEGSHSRAFDSGNRESAGPGSRSSLSSFSLPVCPSVYPCSKHMLHAATPFSGFYSCSRPYRSEQPSV